MAKLRTRTVDEGRGQDGARLWAAWCEDMRVALESCLPPDGYTLQGYPRPSPSPSSGEGSS